jgi:hypothetical protein
MPNPDFSERALARLTEEPRLATERRDTELAITLWHEKASELGSPPPVEAFDLSQAMDWGYRFIICGAGISDSVFLMYGPHFARLLGLPVKANYYDPIIVQLPTRYRPLFTEGCEAASAAPGAAKFNGAVTHNGCTELYRAAFMPLRLRVDSIRPIVFGSFNYRALARVPERWRERSA